MPNQNFTNDNQAGKENENVSSPEIPEIQKRNPSPLILAFIFIFIFLVIIAGGFTAFAYFNKIWPFANKSINSSTNATPSASQTPIVEQVEDWNLALSKIPICDAKTQWTQANINFDNDILKSLGINNLIEQEYAVAQLCRDDSADRIAFILAKQELTKPAPDIEPMCVNSCDKVIFGNINTKTKEVNYKISNHHLGIYAEAYNQFCFIDKIVSSDDLAINGLLLFYCGSGESGGLTSWYSYGLGNDNLTLVQQMTNLEPETFNVKDEKLLSLFRYKSNASIKTTSPASLPTSEPSISQPSPTVESRRQQVGSISILVPQGYQLKENTLFIEALKSQKMAENLVGVWVILSDVSNALQQEVIDGKITEEEAAKKSLESSMGIEIREEKNPKQLELETWLEQNNFQYYNLKSGPDFEVTSNTTTIAGKTGLIKSIRGIKLGNLTMMYFFQLQPKGNVIAIISWEIASRPFQDQVENLLDSIQ